MKKDDREEAIRQNERAKRERADNIAYYKELKRLIREKHKLGNTNKLY